MSLCCNVSPELIPVPTQIAARSPSRRQFLRRLSVTAAALTAADFLSYFCRFGFPHDAHAAALAEDAVKANDKPNFLIYWYLEGGWAGYDMFNPVVTPNNVLKRLDDVSAERYRVLKFGEPGYGIYKQGNIRYGYLAEEGKSLFKDMAVLSSMHTGSFHSGERLKVHMGEYDIRLQSDREEDERSVTQAFAEVCGQPYLLPNLSWHWWLADGELNEVQYTGRKGYYHALGPVHAHTIYAGTPANLKKFLQRMQATSGDEVDKEIQDFLDDANRQLLKDDNIEAVKSYQSARRIYEQLAQAGNRLDKTALGQLFTDRKLRSEFGAQPADELITYRSVNGNKARSKFSPNSNVQALMTYELLRAGLACAFWIESRDIRRFDSHFSRGKLWKEDRTPVGQIDQTKMMSEDLWKPLLALVRRLKDTQYQKTGTSLFDHTTIVLTSEFGRTIHGDVEVIKKMKIPDKDKEKQINGQDICQHWKVTSAAFLGGKVCGDRQYGGVGEKTLVAIPLMPDGSMDHAFDPVSGELKAGAKKSDLSSIPSHGDVYATALHLADINPKGRGRNSRGALTYIKKA